MLVLFDKNNNKKKHRKNMVNYAILFKKGAESP